jgi:gliding motility-associated-like protein
LRNNYIVFSVFCFFVFCGRSYSQTASVSSKVLSSSIVKPNPFVSKDPFGGRAFIENKGQYKDIDSNKVEFAIDNGLEKIYFTTKGLVYELTKVYPITERQRESLEKGDADAIKPNKLYFVNMNWIGSNQNIAIEPSEKQSYYVTYGEKELNSWAFKKITYKNVYNGIDIEYIIPEDKNLGIKYSLIVNPGADPNNVKISYTGDVDRISTKNNEVIIKTPLEDIIEHSPASFIKDGDAVSSLFKVQDDILSYDFPNGYDANKTLIVDPWVSSTNSLSTNSYAYDVDYDFLGNTYVYGGYNPFKVACYSNAGVFQWVFGGTVSSIGWSSAPITSQASNFGVDRFTSKHYIGQGYVTGGNKIVRIDNQGNYDNFVNTANSSFQEVWDMGFHCTTVEVFVLGGTTSSNNSAVTINTTNATLNLSTFQPTISTGFQDIASHAIDDAANIYVLYGSGISSLNNHISWVNSTFNGNVWTQTSNYSTFSEQGNKNQYQGAGSLSSNGFNALAVNANYLFYYNGYDLAAYNKSTGALIGSTTISGQTVKQQGGIAVDDCNNLYLGGNGSILTYSFNGSSFSSNSSISLNTSTTQYVYDIKLDKQTKLLYVCGSNFVGVYTPSPTLSCPTLSSMCLFAQGGIGVSSNSITCANLGSATCTAVGGIGPFSYTWIPSMQSGSVANNLGPGTQVIVVHDYGTGQTYTAATFISPVVPFTGSVPNITLNCYGVNNGTAAVLNLAGGSGNQSYLWTNGTNTYSTPTVSGLGVGAYTVTVTDALTACQINQAFTVTQPPALTLNIGATSPTACAYSSIMLTPLIGGGQPGYTYSWTVGPTTGPWLTTQTVGGTYIYTLTAKDSKSCSITQTTSLNFLYTPTLSLNSVSICPFQTGVLTVSGANTYAWSNNTTGNTLSASPLSTTVYSVVGSGSLCSSSATAAIILKSIPVPTLGNNSPVCSTQTLNLYAGGGVSYVWNGPQNYTSSVASPAIGNVSTAYSGVYNATVTGANSCTASASTTVLIKPSPVVTALGSTVCTTQTLSLSGNSNPAATIYFWTGPAAFNSVTQNTSIAQPAVNMSGNYTLIVQDVNSCTNSAVAHVTVTAMPTPSFSSNSPLCFGSSLNFNANSTVGAINYSWAGPDNFSSSVQNPTITNISLLANGSYTLTVTAGPCVNNVFHPVTIYPLPTVTVQGNSGICETKTIVLNANGSPEVNKYKWTGPLGYVSYSNTVTRSPAVPPHSGVYTIVVTDTNNCFNSSTISISVLPNPILAVSNLTVCFLEPAVLTATGAASYVWTDPYQVQYPVQHMTILQALNTSPVIYTVMGTAANSCTRTATVELATIPLPKPSLNLVPSRSLCVNQSVYFTGYGGFAYEWRGPNNFYFEGQNMSLTPTNWSYGGTYTLTAIDNYGCRASVDTAITIYNLPAGSLFGTKMEECVPFCSDYEFKANGSSSVTANWLLSGKLLSGTTFSFCFTEPGNYLARAILVDLTTSCTNTVNYPIIAHPKPVADFTYTPEIPIENIDNVLFISTSQGEELTKFKWHFVNEKSPVSTHESASYLFETEGVYPVVLEVKNAWGCLDTIIKAIHINPDFALYVPNVFTPNEDDKNEVFRPVMRAVKAYHISVFDRWGELLFQTNDINSGWDGTYKGEPCKSDVYAWKITISGINGDNKEVKGHVTLYR